MHTTLFIPADPTHQVRIQHTVMPLRIEEIYDLVCPDPDRAGFEAVTLYDTPRGANSCWGGPALYIDENGKFAEKPVSNWRARALCSVGSDRPAIMPGDFIAGNAILCGPPDDDGETSSLSELVLNWALRLVGAAELVEA